MIYHLKHLAIVCRKKERIKNKSGLIRITALSFNGTNNLFYPTNYSIIKKFVPGRHVVKGSNNRRTFVDFEPDITLSSRSWKVGSWSASGSSSRMDFSFCCWNLHRMGKSPSRSRSFSHGHDSVAHKVSRNWMNSLRYFVFKRWFLFGVVNE